MLTNKILFVLDRYSYDNNKISLLEDLIFLSYANNLNSLKSSENAIFEDSPNRTLIFSSTVNLRDFASLSTFIANSRFVILLFFISSSFSLAVKNDSFNVDNASNVNNVALNICEMVVSIYYSLTRKKKCKLFILTIISDAFITLILCLTKTYLRNKHCSYNLDIKFKRCCDDFSRLNLVFSLNNLLITLKITLLILNI